MLLNVWSRELSLSTSNLVSCHPQRLISCTNILNVWFRKLSLSTSDLVYYISKKCFWIPGCRMDSGILLDSRGFWPCDFSNPGFWTRVSATRILDTSFCCSGIPTPFFCCWRILVPPFLFKLTLCVKCQTFIHVTSVILAMTSVLSQYRKEFLFL